MLHSEKAIETVKLATKYRDAGAPIVGIDFSGNPMVSVVCIPHSYCLAHFPFRPSPRYTQRIAAPLVSETPRFHSMMHPFLFKSLMGECSFALIFDSFHFRPRFDWRQRNRFADFQDAFEYDRFRVSFVVLGCMSDDHRRSHAARRSSAALRLLCVCVCLHLLPDVFRCFLLFEVAFHCRLTTFHLLVLMFQLGA